MLVPWRTRQQNASTRFLRTQRGILVRFLCDLETLIFSIVEDREGLCAVVALLFLSR